MTDDGGSIQVLEAVIVATLMLTSIAFVVTFDETGRVDDSARAGLQQRISDALAILDATPSRSAMGDTLLSSYVASCLQGDCSLLKAKLDRALPQGASYALYISNGQGVYEVYAPRSPSGPSVTARLAFEPRWSSTFLSAAVPLVNPAGDPVVLYALPIYNSNPLTSDGTSVLITMRGTRVSDGAEFTIQGALATTASGAAEAAPHTSASLYFVNQTGSVLPMLDARATTLTLANTPTGSPVELRLRLAETGGLGIPSGTRVTVSMPPGWTAVASNNSDWNVTANATDSTGSDVVARLTHSVTSTTADLTLNATYAGEANDYYAIRAAASGGVLARGALLVRADSKNATPTFEVPTLVLGAPRPLGVGTATTWTMSAHLPALLPGVPAEAVNVTSVTIHADNGDAIFGSVTGLTNASGAWSIVGKNLTWQGSALLTHESPLGLAFNATGLAVARPASDRAAFTPRVSLDGQRASLMDETSPGMRRVALAPGTNGYNASTGATLATNHSASATEPYRATALPGSAAYAVGYVSTLQDALFGSAVIVGQRNVAAGSTQTIHVAAQPAMFTLASLGYAPSLELKVYPPWSGDARVPVYSTVLAVAQLGPNGTYLSLIDSNGDGTPDDATAGIFDVDIPIAANSFYGAYVVEVEAKWSEEVSQVVGGVPLTGIFERTARVYDSFVVTPPSLITPPVPVYDAHLVAWFDDWR